MKNMVLITVMENWYDCDDQFAWTILGREVHTCKEGYELFEKAARFMNMKDSIWKRTEKYKQVRTTSGMSHIIELKLEEVECF